MKNKISPLFAQSLGNLATALGLVAALAWNEAVKTTIEHFLPKGQGILSLFIYAILVTTLVVIFSARLLKIKERLEAERAE